MAAKNLIGMVSVPALYLSMKWGGVDLNQWLALVGGSACQSAGRAAATMVGIHMVISRPLLSHSTTGEFNSPPKYLNHVYRSLLAYALGWRMPHFFVEPKTEGWPIRWMENEYVYYTTYYTIIRRIKRIIRLCYVKYAAYYTTYLCGQPGPKTY